MDIGILITFLFLLATMASSSNLAAPMGASDTVSGLSSAPKSVTDSLNRKLSDSAKPSLRDSLQSKPSVLPQPKGLFDSTGAWTIPLREGSPGSAFREAFRNGDPTVPWNRVFEFDGMWEEWRTWPSLPIEERGERPSWTGPSIAGVSDPGPLEVVAVAKRLEPGFGGMPVRRELSAPSPVDTPLTQLVFWRGALASYKFGLDFSRAVWGPWGLEMRMETRSAQGKSWTYRDQIQDMFQGSFGRNREDLPAKGRSPGQDDVQWETVVSRATPGLLVELGWTWVDLQRGIPDPRTTWNSLDTILLSGHEARSGWFGRMLGRSGEVSSMLSGRVVGQEWERGSWPDSGGPVGVRGSTDHQELEGDLGWGGSVFKIGVCGRGALRTGTSSTVSDFQEDQERLGGYATLAGESYKLRLDAAWNRLNDPLDRTLTGPDGALNLDGEVGFWKSQTRLARELKMPNWEISILPDPLLRSLPSRQLVSEGRWVVEHRDQVAVFPWLSLDAGGAGIWINDAIDPKRFLTGRPHVWGYQYDLVLTNATGPVMGWSAQTGARATWRGAWIASQWSVGSTLAPNGSRDLRYPLVNSRTSLGWEGKVLAGRAHLASAMSLQVWSSSMDMSGSDGGDADLQAQVVALPSGYQLDWENRMEIRTFGIFWRLENLLDDQQVPAIGWTPPGIRSGWGITWNFGG